MNKMKTPRWMAHGVLTLTVAGLVAGCATGQDAARFEQRPTVQTFPVTIVAVDGAPSSGSGASLLQPGLRKVTVQWSRPAGAAAPEQRTIDLDVKPCTRYWLVASRDAKAPDAALEVKVDHTQVDHACLARAAR